jgi:hypothetical protein
MDQHRLNLNRPTFNRNSPAWNFIFYRLILVTEGKTERGVDIASSYVLPIFFFYFVQNVVCNFKNKAVFQLITN